MSDVLQPIDMNVDGGHNESPKTKKKKRLSVERIYQKKTQLEHILLRPDAYIGSVEPEQQQMWVLDEVDGSECILQKQITLVPGFYKIFDEILVNAADNKQRDKEMNTIKIVIDQEKNFISVWNNGKGIPIEIHKEQHVYVPTLIFGQLLTSSNYDDTQKKVTGGRNGFGAKLCNIFSTKFTVETACNEYKKKFKQVWGKNMTNAGEAQITDYSGKDYTKVSYTPDLAKFHMDRLDNDIVALLKRRAYDIAGTSKGVTVYLNGEKIKITSFKEYIELYMKGASRMAQRDDEDDTKLKIVHEIFHPRWEVCVTVSKSGFQQASFVNSIATTKGGTHVNYIVDQITEKMITAVKRKTSKEMKVKPFQIKNHLWVFVNCLIENPTFDSQTKENMTLRAKAFGSTCEVNEKFIKMVQQCGVMDSIMNWVKFKSQEKMNQKCNHGKKSKIKIPKLDDANDAGGKNSSGCTLILTEGDSAKTLAISGLSIVGRDRFGVFPLRGKLLNVRDAPSKQIAENVEITSLLQIIGLNFKKKYATEDERKTLRYGKIMIMADQDQDGSHIKGLVINFIHANWPHLIQGGFLEQFITPIVKATKGKEQISFFSLPQFEEWKNQTPNNHTWKVKYYKGLGTSTSEEAKEYFKGIGRHRINFTYGGVSCDQAIEMAFGKKHIQSRKDWLTRGMGERRRRRQLGMPEIYLYHEDTKDVTYTDFVNKELILFSNADNERSIPSLVDGLKPGQRKVLFTCFKRNDKREVKVAQLAGSIAELSAYHHGENSLYGTIVNMAQNFVGSNNINLLQPIGAFGSRIHGGKDAASPRYIFTMLSPLTRLIYPLKDDVLLNYLSEDNQKIEPEWYCPIIPMVLVNGSEGIGTGYRSAISNYCPRELVKNIRKLLAGEEPEPMIPFFKNFKGTIQQVEAQKFNAYGLFNVVDEKSFEITELPIRTWTSPYKESVLDVLENGNQKVRPIVADTRDHSTDKSIHFHVTLTSEEEMAKTEEEGISKKFKLETSLSAACMVLHDRYGCLKKYETTGEILKEFFEVRLEYYHKQKDYYVGFLDAEANRLSSQARFILEKIDGDIVLEKRTKRDVVMTLVQRSYPSDPVKTWKSEHRAEAAADDQSDTASSVSSSESGPDFGYLLGMTMLSLTKEKVEELLKQRDEKKAELEDLRRKTPEELWDNDLEIFLAELDRVEEEERQLQEESERNYGGAKVGKRQMKITAKPKKKPLAQADQAKKPAKKPKLEEQKEEEAKPAEEAEPLTLAQRMAKAGKKKAPAKKPPKKNKWDFDSSEDEDEILDISDDEGERVKRETRKKPAKKYILSDDEDDSVQTKDDNDSNFDVNDADDNADTKYDFDAARATGPSNAKQKSLPVVREETAKDILADLSDSDNSEIEATKALIAKLTPTKAKPSQSEASKTTIDLVDLAVDHEEIPAPKAKKQISIFDAAANGNTKQKKSSVAAVGKSSEPKEAEEKKKGPKGRGKGKSVAKPSQAAKRKAPKKSSSDGEESSEGKAPAKSKKSVKAPKKKVQRDLDSDDDMSDEDDNSFKDVAPPPRREAIGRRGKSKVCYQLSSDEDDDSDFAP